MKDSLEKYIIDHRTEMDPEIPPDKIWDGIKKELHFKKSNNNYSYLWKIAAGFFLVMSTVLAVLLYQSEKSETPESLGDLSPRYRIMEKKYQQDIDQLTSQLDFEKLGKEEFAWMIEELETLEKINEKFQNDLSKNVNRDKVVRALIDYYEKKIKLLKRIELEIKRNENEKKSSIS